VGAKVPNFSCIAEERWKKEDGRRKKEEGRRKKEEGRRKNALRHSRVGISLPFSLFLKDVY
jgi:hypothetical protein